MKKLLWIVMIAAVVVTISSCGGKTQPVPFDDGDSTDMSAMQDPTIYGVCGEGSAMNTLQLVTDLGDTIQLDLTYARENNQVFGGLQAGDRMAVVPNAKKTEALIVINQVALLGNWVMPNPIDGSSEVGIRIKEGGIAESIDQPTVIVTLSPDSLVLKEGDDLYEYGRQQLKKPDSDIKLEEASEDDYKI